MTRDSDSKIRHDLRNAVNGIMGLLEVLANTKLDSDQRKFVRMASASARSVIDITESAFPEVKLPVDTLSGVSKNEVSLRGTLKVLAADDDKVNRLLIEHHLKELAGELKLVSDGEEALSAFSAQSYDLVILDYVMPVVNGLDVAEEIRKNSGVPILIVTGGMSVEVSSRCQELGNTTILFKPFTKADLHKRIIELLPNAPIHETDASAEYYHFSPESLAKLSMGDPALAEGLLVDLLEEIQESQSAAQEAVVREDREALRPIIQSMQSVATTILAGLLSNTLKKLEQSLEEESWELINIVIGALWIHCQSLKIEIERYLQTLKD
ncbi:MAG: response regulator [Planctomycetota bacterium]|nr:response regulator [Planctomycetota bacterium]